MSSGDELYVRAIFSSEEVKHEVEAYLVGLFKQLLRTTLVRNPVHTRALIGSVSFSDEHAMLRNFVSEFTSHLLEEAVKEEVLRVYLREQMHAFIQEQVKRCVASNLKAFEKAFNKQRTIPKGVTK
jgi:hypothetical protein